MGDPIKPSDEIVLGGVKFNANSAQSYGKIPKPLASDKEFFIDFKNGTRVEFNDQTKLGTGGIFNNQSNFGVGETFDPSQKHAISINHKDDLNRSYDIKVENCKDIDLTLEQDKRFNLKATNCENLQIDGSENNKKICVKIDYSNNVDVKTGDGDDTVLLMNMGNVNVNTEAGNDIIINGFYNIKPNDMAYYTKNNNSNIDPGQGEDRIVYTNISGDALTPDRHTKGKVILDNEDILSIHSAIREVKVQGEGTHNLNQTPSN